MTTKERMALLKEWEEQFHVVDEAWASLEKLFRGLDTESAISRAMWKTFEKYTEAQAARLEGEPSEDNENWLSWYCWENDMGQNEYPAKVGIWKKSRKIRSLADLCKLIEGGKL